jgi:TolB-like protein
VRFLLLPILALLPAVANAASTGVAFLNRPLSVRQMGMGNVAPGENDVLRVWSNPAVLAGQATAGEIALNGASRPETGQSSFGAGAGYRFGNGWAVGLTFANDSVSFAEFDDYGAATGVNLASSAMAVGLTAARPFGAVLAGVTAKFVSESIANESATGVALDAGMTGEWGNLTAGLSARNVGPALRKAEADLPAEALPMELRAGVSYRIVALNSFVGGEYVAAAGRSGILGAGFGWAPLELFTVRAGYAGIAVGGEQEPVITVGFSGRYASIGLDYAAGLHAMGLAHRVSLSYAFGRSAKELTEEAELEASAPEPEPEKQVTQAKSAKGRPEKKAPEGLPNVAVMDFTPQNVSAGDAAVISDMLRGELVRTRACNVIEKQNMDKILAEQTFQNSGCTSEECAVKLGKLLNVNKIVVGSFGKMMNTHILNIRVVDVESGKIIFGDKVTGTSLNELDKGISALAKRLAKQVR